MRDSRLRVQLAAEPRHHRRAADHDLDGHAEDEDDGRGADLRRSQHSRRAGQSQWARQPPGRSRWRREGGREGEREGEEGGGGGGGLALWGGGGGACKYAGEGGGGGLQHS